MLSFHYAFCLFLFCCFFLLVFFCSFWKEDLQTFLMQPLRPTLLSHSQHKSPDPLLCMRLESRFLLIFRFSQAQTTDWLASASALCVVTMDTITWIYHLPKRVKKKRLSNLNDFRNLWNYVKTPIYLLYVTSFPFRSFLVHGMVWPQSTVHLQQIRIIRLYSHLPQATATL